MTRVTYNEYLDRRNPAWVDAETFGLVSTDKVARLVEIRDPEIERAFVKRS